jgi:hypothetical protein
MVSAPSAFFPSVMVYRGHCLGEHGNSVSRLVAIDSAGVLYLLDSPSAFRLLILRHPPLDPTRDSLTLVNYAMTALVMRGVIDAEAKVVTGAADVPAGVLAGMPANQRASLSTRIIQRGHSTRLRVITIAAGLIETHDVFVQGDGEVDSASRDVWRPSNPPDTLRER